MWRPWRPYLLALSFALGAILNVLADDPTFTTIDFPGATQTDAHGINARGDIVGGYANPGENTTLPGGSLPHAFLLSRGHFSNIDFPGATYTFASRNNARGDIVGWYSSADNLGHGYLLSGDEFASIDFSGASYTNANSINPRGDIVGRYDTADGQTHGYLLSGGEFTSIEFPGASRFTTAIGINPRGDIVGKYKTADGLLHGYLLTR